MKRFLWFTTGCANTLTHNTNAFFRRLHWIVRDIYRLHALSSNVPAPFSPVTVVSTFMASVGSKLCPHFVLCKLVVSLAERFWGRKVKWPWVSVKQLRLESSHSQTEEHCVFLLQKKTSVFIKPSLRTL